MSLETAEPLLDGFYPQKTRDPSPGVEQKTLKAKEGPCCKADGRAPASFSWPRSRAFPGLAAQGRTDRHRLCLVGCFSTTAPAADLANHPPEPRRSDNRTVSPRALQAASLQ